MKGILAAFAVILVLEAGVQGFAAGEVSPKPQSDPLRLFTQCTFADGLQVVAADRLPAHVRSRDVVTAEGSKSVSLVDGYRVMLAYPGSEYFVNLKVERSDASRYPGDKGTIIGSMQHLSDKSSIEAKTRVPLEHKNYRGFNLYAVNFPTINFYIANNPPTLGGGPVSTYVLFMDSTSTIFTVYFLNQRPERRNFKSLEEYRALRDRFLDAYTSCVIRSAP